MKARGTKHKARILVMAMALIGAVMALAMPTQQELKKAQPLVAELMAPIVDDFKAKKKTAAEVADAAVKYASEAETEAAKFMLYRSSIPYYVRGEAYDRAAETVVQLKANVKDVPAEVVAEIISKATVRANKEKAPRLFELYQRAKTQATAEKDVKEFRKKPASTTNKRKLAEALATTGNWQEALKEFASLTDQTAQMAKGEQDGSAKSAVLGEFWWAYKPTYENAEDTFKIHAVAFYRKSLAAGEITGLKKPIFEQRIRDFGVDDAERPASVPAAAHSAASKMDAGRNVAARKLKECDFLLNKGFKRNAKFYLCLFSASWCPPCRREMPRIAKTYAGTLKDDPDIELIHFSRDQDDERALAWAKEHDVKFPVVKPKGGNPLELRTQGIPHLFIVKADGTLVEEGHPMKVFKEEKFRELKGESFAKGVNSQIASGNANITGDKADNGMRTKGWIAKAHSNLQTSEANGVKWLYVDTGNGVNLAGADSSLPQKLVIPNEIDGKKVLTIAENAFENNKEIVSLETPDGITSIGRSAFAGCPNLESVRILSGLVRWSVFRKCPKLKSAFVGKNVRSLEYGSFAACERLDSVVIEEGSVTLKIQDPFEGDVALASLHLPARYDGTEGWCHGAFRGCRSLTKLTISAANPKCRAENGLVLSADGKTLLAVASGLSKIDIPPSVETIPYRAISGCYLIRELVIPNSVKVLDNQCICQCYMLEHITIGSGIERILSPKVGYPTFCDCPKLKSIRFVGNAPAQVDALIYQKVPADLVTYVSRGTTGWNREGGDGLPSLWPTSDGYGRKIAYWE